ncbi:hypothetical protein [Streptomyces sp. NPDC051576]|uniref:hypothetical protein n=1 Tax=Streptomyces sp. NPDC051576 TaxID=3155803 RepID=UPI00341C62B3
MPLFRRAEWPRDHRDELVAGALVGAVVIVLGYASGIGAPSASGEAAAPAATPPAVTAPAATMPVPGASDAQGSGAQVPGDTGVFPVSEGGTGTGSGLGTGLGTGPGQGTLPTATTPTSPSPASPSPTSSPSGSPTAAPPADSCADGEVHLVQPLLGGLTQTLFGVLDGADAEEPTAQASPCIGLAPLGSLLGASASTPTSTSATASPSPEATP